MLAADKGAERAKAADAGAVEMADNPAFHQETGPQSLQPATPKILLESADHAKTAIKKTVAVAVKLLDIGNIDDGGFVTSLHSYVDAEFHPKEKKCVCVCGGGEGGGAMGQQEYFTRNI